MKGAPVKSQDSRLTLKKAVTLGIQIDQNSNQGKNELMELADYQI